MEKLSSFISKKIISLKEGNEVGYVLNLAFEEDLKIFKGFIIVDDESEHTFMLRVEKIKKISDECIVINSSSDLEFIIEDESNNPLGKIVYDKEGTNLGRVVDVVVSGKIVKRIITDKCEFLQRYVYANGHYIIYGNKDKSSKGSVFVANNKNLPKVYIEEVKANVITDNKINVSDYKTNGEAKPYRIYANQDFLSGRIVTNDIFGLNNEIVAKKGEKINNKIINKAKLHNKLSLLNYYSK